MKQNVVDFLNEHQIPFTDEKEYLQIVDKPVRLYAIDDAHNYRQGYYGDEGGVKKNYFQKTSIENEQKGIRTIWIKPWEFVEGTSKRDVLASIILATCGKIGNTFNARDCEVREVTTKELRPFLEKNSFYGFRGSSLALGLFLKKDIGSFAKGTLLMVYTFGHPFFGNKKSAKNKEEKKKYDVEIIRFATLQNSQVRGGATKLFKHFVEKYPTIMVKKEPIEWNTVCYYVDYDHNNGNSLGQLGFDFEYYAKPGFMNVYKESGIPFHRKPMEHKKIMEQIRNGEVYSVFNAGTKVYTYTKNKETEMVESDFVAE